MLRRRRGFTLIELLVVIAIIGILAAMLFPVFARARESARKIQCLSNVKNIALAYQMYLTDYDRLLPSASGPGAEAFINYQRGNGECQSDTSDDEFCLDEAVNCRVTPFNPYLKPPVILDEYIKNRDVWRCPSASLGSSCTITAQTPEQIIASWWAGSDAEPCPHPRPCSDSFPPGWAGAITDTRLQGECGEVIINYTFPRDGRNKATSAINDPAKYVITGDGGYVLEGDRTSWLAYPDFCRIDGVACTSQGWCCGTCADCADSGCCGTDPVCGPRKGEVEFALDPTVRKERARPRHMGGSNLGFADGHAKWMASEDILFSGENWSGWGNDTNKIEGWGVCIVPTTECCGSK